MAIKEIKTSFDLSNKKIDGFTGRIIVYSPTKEIIIDSVSIGNTTARTPKINAIIYGTPLECTNEIDRLKLESIDSNNLIALNK